MRILVFTLLGLVLLLPPAARGSDALIAAALQDLELGPVSVHDAWVKDGVLEVLLSGDALFFQGRDLQREDTVSLLLWTARAVDASIAGIQVYVETADGKQALLNELVADPDEEALVRALRMLPGRSRGLPPEDLPYGGSLIGRTIVLSPGHGWTYNDSLRDWGFQRGFINLPGCGSCLGITEDLSNAEIMASYVIPHLLRAGATVWSVRERDLNAFDAVWDEDHAGVIEEGGWQDGSSQGGYGDDYRYLAASSPGRMLYPLEPDAEGDYWVSVWYVAGTNRVSDAEFRIRHLGGEAVHHVDQQVNGSRWMHLGAYRFAEAGGELEIAAGPDAEPDGVLIADAVRLGGGFDTTVIAGAAADKPRWMMDALTSTLFIGMPDWVNPGNDVTVRPAFAEWQGADAFISLHSNATGGGNNATGTCIYRYNCGSFPDHSPAPDPALCDDPPGSDALMDAVHSAIIINLRANWDPNWVDRGTLVANFGEVRVLDSIPGILIESAFHDGTEAASGMLMPDNESLQDPRFRELLGYAIYQGLARFFDPGVTLLPVDRPSGLYLVHDAQGMRVGWEPVAAALGYRVRIGSESQGLSEGQVSEETSLALADLTPGQLVAVRVSALNSGGEGPPSELAVGRFRGDAQSAQVLLVSGFDRQDARIGEGRNRRHYSWTHAEALAALDREIWFDFASNESIESGQVQLGGYQAAIWNLGEESTVEETFSLAEQQLVSAYLDSGGALLASGAEIGWDLVAQGSVDDSAFFQGAFGAVYLSDDAETFQAQGTGLFSAVGSLDFDDGSAGIYPVEYPDVFLAAGGETVLEYQGGTCAAVAWERSLGRTVVIGFPFETIVDPQARIRLMEAAIDFLLPEIPQDGGTSDATDAGDDAGMDAGDDAGADPGSDPGSDPGADPGRDAGSDPGPGPSGDNGCGCGQQRASTALMWLLGLIGLAIIRHTRRRP